MKSKNYREVYTLYFSRVEQLYNGPSCHALYFSKKVRRRFYRHFGMGIHLFLSPQDSKNFQ
ncbi:unnamed protein product [Meloidogyne enterolobii]|uniref:Uncharacterized protein n=1 Tax=Meloidogyne enterolobii TaxID=390850 RepID=A0ACB1AIK7_MELEN